MSHSVNIKTQLKNIKTLLAQFELKGWKIVNNEKCNTYPSDPRRHETHEYVAKNPQVGGYDIGINLDSEGNSYFVCDFFDSSIERQLGENLKDIKQGYAIAEIKKNLSEYEEDLDYKITELPTGELVVIAEK